MPADIVYGTNNEFGFDYLRDNMVLDCSTWSSASSTIAIVDEVDNILIDEARTPLIISGAGGGIHRASTSVRPAGAHSARGRATIPSTRSSALSPSTERRHQKIERALGIEQPL